MTKLKPTNLKVFATVSILLGVITGCMGNVFLFGLLLFVAILSSFLTVITFLIDNFAKTHYAGNAFLVTLSFVIMLITGFFSCKAMIAFRRERATQFIRILETRKSSSGCYPMMVSESELKHFYLDGYYPYSGNKSFTIHQCFDGWGWQEYNSKTKDWAYKD